MHSTASSPIPRFLHNLKINMLILWYHLDPHGRLRRSGAKVGDNVFIGLHTYIELENAALLTIEDDVTIAAQTRIILHDSSLKNVLGGEVLYGPVILCKRCYIGANTTILQGSEVGAGTIVGANSLVKGKLKAHSVYLGQPARYYCSTKELAAKWKKREQ